MNIYKDIIIIGGGAAGFFAAINIAESYPKLSVAILERGKHGLQKVKISGGGRCNVTHAEFVPSELTLNYPRGEKELLGPFHTFMTGDSMAWFEARGVPLKIEDDGRVFPVSNTSQTVIDCFLKTAKEHHVDVLYNHIVKALKRANNKFVISTSQDTFTCHQLVVATGSNLKIWNLLKRIGHHIVPPVPSLFTFDVNDKRLKNIPGVVVKNVEVTVEGTHLVSEGPLLITHVGLSAPAILKLSAFGALELFHLNYNFTIAINFIKQDFETCINQLKTQKQHLAKKLVINSSVFDLPRRLWKELVLAAQITTTHRWADINKQHIEALANQLTKAVFKVTGKSTFKDEFVTAGGIDLKEINFKTFESKLIPNLYFAGEIINVDAITGGFNFQNAWTSAYIVSQSIKHK